MATDSAPDHPPPHTHTAQASPALVLSRTFDFLGLSAVSVALLQTIAAWPVAYLPGSNSTFSGDRQVINRIRGIPAATAKGGHVLTRVPELIPPKAATLLQDFYTPLNAELAAMLGDDSFLWRDII